MIKKLEPKAARAVISGGAVFRSPILHSAFCIAPAPPPRRTHRISAGMDLYGIEADDFATAVLDGTPPRMSAEDSIGNMRILDEMRRRLG